jgi:hypothetical protein
VRGFVIFDFRFWIGLLALPMVGGCAALGVAAQRLSPPPTIEAQYVLPKIPTVILVESYHDGGARIADAETLTRYVYEDLKNQAARKKGKGVEELVPLVDWKKVYELRSADPGSYAKMKITEIGKRLGAGQVIYVDLIDSGVLEMMGNDVLRGRAAARVRVVDCETGGTKWPEGTSGGMPVGFETDLKRPAEGASYTQVREETLEKMGQKVGRLFHSWQAEE